MIAIKLILKFYLYGYLYLDHALKIYHKLALVSP